MTMTETSRRQKVLITGGAGYIGSHTCVELLNTGHELLVIDNLVNSKEEALRRVEKIAGKSVAFLPLDVRDKSGLMKLFANEPIGAVVHFAGLKAVGESVEKPLAYYDANFVGTVTLLEAMASANVRTMVFSSSATVYGNPNSVPISENFPLSATNPYGRSKLMIEDMLRDLYRSDSRWKIALLRYFNPVGAHHSGLIGEDPNGIPNNLMPIVTQVAIGKRESLSVYGNDYPTPDGTGVRDYIHVVDLARGHLRALEALDRASDMLTVNLGTGKGYSVLEVIRAFEAVSGKSIPHKLVERRAGDIAECFANPARATELLGWKAELNLDRMCADSWRWQRQNPQGYGD
jgi:UDP-glucose 4-epimerase